MISRSRCCIPISPVFEHKVPSVWFAFFQNTKNEVLATKESGERTVADIYHFA
jgi:hypothetical protein